MAAKCGGYKLAASFRTRTKTGQADPAPATTGGVSRVSYDAVLEYATALEDNSLELKLMGGGEWGWGQELNHQQPPRHIRGNHNPQQHHCQADR